MTLTCRLCGAAGGSNQSAAADLKEQLRKRRRIASEDGSASAAVPAEDAAATGKGDPTEPAVKEEATPAEVRTPALERGALALTIKRMTRL